MSRIFEQPSDSCQSTVFRQAQFKIILSKYLAFLS